MTEPTRQNESVEDREFLTPDDLFLNVISSSLGIAASDHYFSLTVLTAGGVVTGSAVSVGTWHRAMVERARAVSEEFGEALSVLDGLIEVWTDDARDRDERGLPTVPPQFLHMKDATLVTPLGAVKIGLWRGRIDRIGGWSLSAMEF